MGTSHSVPEFAAKIAAGGVAIAAANRQAVTAAAQAAKVVTLQTAVPDTGGDLRLSRWGKNGVRLNVGYEVAATSPDYAVARVSPRPLGVWRVLNDGSKPHPIVPGAKRGSRRAGRVAVGFGPTLPAGSIAEGRSFRGSMRVLSFGPGQVAAYATHPGSKGKNTWTRGVETARPLATRTYQIRHQQALLTAFK